MMFTIFEDENEPLSERAKVDEYVLAFIATTHQCVRWSGRREDTAWTSTAVVLAVC
jgi:hypothetical protein